MVSHASKVKTGTIAVPIPADLVAEIDDLVGVDGRQEFVRAAVAERFRRVRSFHDAIDRLQGKMIPEWDTPESTAAWLREIREWPDRWVDDAEPER